jgi:hypothetical protein
VRARTGPRARTWVRGAIRVGMTTVLVLAALMASAAAAAAADPTASPGSGGDVRTNPSAPGLIGDPLFAIMGVALVGLVAVGVTLLAVRLSDRR